MDPQRDLRGMAWSYLVVEVVAVAEARQIPDLGEGMQPHRREVCITMLTLICPRDNAT